MPRCIDMLLLNDEVVETTSESTHNAIANITDSHSTAYACILTMTLRNVMGSSIQS